MQTIRQALSRCGMLLALTASVAGLLGMVHGQAVPRAAEQTLQSPLLFLENVGQLSSAARFEAQGDGANVFLSDDAVWFSRLAPNQAGEQNGRVHGVNIRQSFVGANQRARLEPYSRLDTQVTYLHGGKQVQQQAQTQAWAGVRYIDLYPGIDLLVTSQAGQLAQQLEVHPGADLSAVRLRLEGAERVSVQNGRIELETEAGSFTLPLLSVRAGTQGLAQSQPTVTGNQIIAPFSLEHASSNVAAESSSSSFGLIYGARFGGSDYDRGNGITVDDQGAVYIAGGSLSPNMPTTPGAFDTAWSGDVRDAFVAKLNPAGSAPEYITYLGGTKDDWGLDVAVNKLGEAFVTGYTASPDFPLKQQAQSYGGQFDAFAVKLAASGGALQYATYLGGSANDRAYAISIDKRGAAYIAGSAGESFPLVNPADGTCTNTDGFVVKLSPDGATREYATCLGGSANEYADGIGVNDRGEAYVAGVTRSSDFPATSNAYDRSYGGGDDMFVAKLAASGNTLQYATYLGSTGDDVAGIANVSIGSDGSATIAGYTDSPSFPTTAQAFDRSYNGLEDVVVATISASGGDLVYSSFLGGSGDDRSFRVVQTNSGDLLVSGETASDNFPTTANAFDQSFGGGNRDVFVAQISNGNTLSYSTFYGGSGDDNGGVFVLAGNANGDDPDIASAGDQATLYMTGATNSFDFPGTLGAYSAAAQGSSDTFVAKLQIKDSQNPPANTPTNTPTEKPTNTPTNTRTPSPTPTLRPGETARPTSTPTRTPTATRTPSPTHTSAPTSTPNQSAGTSVPTITPYNTPTTQPGATGEPGPPPSAPQPIPTAVTPRPGGRIIFAPIVTFAGRIIGPCSDIEDNDTPAQARPMSPIGETCSASFRDDPEGEDDYYVINARAGQTLQITLNRVPSQADYDLIVYTSGLAQVAVSNKSGEADEQITYLVPQTGNYMIRINMARESLVATNDYQLNVSLR